MTKKSEMSEPNHDCNAHSVGFCFDCDECGQAIELDCDIHIAGMILCETCAEQQDEGEE